MKTSLVAACLVLVGCGSSPKPAEPLSPSDPAPAGDPLPGADTTPAAAPVAKSLYDRLGGTPAITAVVAEFVGRTTTDPRVKDRFYNTDPEELKKLLVEFVCMASGGPCKYTGRDMEASHGGMEVDEVEWTAVVEALVGALDKFNVPEKEKGELLGAIGPLKPQIVTPADKLKPLPEAQLAKVAKVAAGLKNPPATELLTLAVTAGRRGQRSYAEQLFTRAEMLTGPKALVTISKTFRAGGPPLVTSKLKTMPADTAAQPRTVGGSEADEPDKTPAKGSLTGSLLIDGKPPAGLGVVMLWPEKGPKKKRTPKQRIIEQRGKQFAPHVMAVPVGSTVSFPNFDTIFHNVFSLSKSKAFDLGMYKNGETREVKVDKPGIVRLGCNLHANMSAYLIVVDAPHYVVVDADGAFTFKSLAPGKYKVQAWNERSGEPMTSTVEVKDGANQTKLDLASGGSRLSPDKFGIARQ